MGEVAGEIDALGVGDGEDDCTRVARNAFKSGLLITNAPSCSPVRASEVPSDKGAAIVNLCSALSSAEVVKVMTSCGLSNAPAGTFVTQRTACNEASVFSNDCTLTVLIGPFPATHCHSLLARRTKLCSRSVKTAKR